MISVSVKGVLIGVLLIALIVLVVFLIVMVANVTDTIKKANAIIDGSTNAAKGAKDRASEVNTMIRDKAAQARGLASTGIQIAGKAINKIIK